MSFTIKRGPVAADNYTIIANALVRDHRLSFKARGLAVWLLSHRADFALSMPRIAELNGCGEASIRSAVDELEKVGYLRREQDRDGGKFGSTTYYITDVSPGGDRRTENHRRENRERENRERETEVHKKTTSLEDHSGEVPGAVAPELPLDLPKPEESQDEAKPPTLNQRAVLLAQAHYERLGKMGNVPAWVKIIRKALDHGYDDATVDRVLAWLADRNWTLTEERLANALRGGPRPAGNTAPTTTRNQVRTGPDGRGPILEYS